MPVCPNLPARPVSKVLMSGIVPSLVNNIQQMGISVIKSQDIKPFISFERTHADLQFLPIDENTAAVLSNCDMLIRNLKKLYKTLIRVSLPENIKYPYNVLLNHTVIGNYVIGNKHAVPLNLYGCFERKKLNFVNVRQGYSKCSTAVVTRNAIITSDETIYKACNKLGLDVLKIVPGYIILSGTNYGFIGGCCGKLSENILAFTGNISLHPDGQKIIRFCRNHGVETLSLSESQLFDIGGIIPLI